MSYLRSVLEAIRHPLRKYHHIVLPSLCLLFVSVLIWDILFAQSHTVEENSILDESFRPTQMDIDDSHLCGGYSNEVLSSTPIKITSDANTINCRIKARLEILSDSASIPPPVKFNAKKCSRWETKCSFFQYCIQSLSTKKLPDMPEILTSLHLNLDVCFLVHERRFFVNPTTVDTQNFSKVTFPRSKLCNNDTKRLSLQAPRLLEFRATEVFPNRTEQAHREILKDMDAWRMFFALRALAGEAICGESILPPA